MGTIAAHPIAQWRTRFGLRVFVETGTWEGDGVREALDAGFPMVFSVDVCREFVEKVGRRFAGVPGIHLLEGLSVDTLPLILARPEMQRVPAMFWLDAHLQDHYGMPVDAFNPFPLRDELSAIVRCRDISRDVFVLDDWRIYDDLNGRIPWRGKSKYAAEWDIANGDFVGELLGATHALDFQARDEGYVVALPRMGAPC